MFLKIPFDVMQFCNLSNTVKYQNWDHFDALPIIGVKSVEMNRPVCALVWGKVTKSQPLFLGERSDPKWI